MAEHRHYGKARGYHCDSCGRPIASDGGIQRTHQGKSLRYCDEMCERRGPRKMVNRIKTKAEA
jgi:hypothetical protein